MRRVILTLSHMPLWPGTKVNRRRILSLLFQVFIILHQLVPRTTGLDEGDAR